jgi:hypothetical protein
LLGLGRNLAIVFMPLRLQKIPRLASILFVPTIEITNAPEGGGDTGSLKILFEECVALLFRHSPTAAPPAANERVAVGGLLLILRGLGRS